MKWTEIGYNVDMRFATLTGTLVLAAMFTVHGSGFRAGERVTVTVTLVGHIGRKTVTAGARGFTVRFFGITYKGCTAFQVRAIGSLGDRAVMVLTPECAPGPTP